MIHITWFTFIVAFGGGLKCPLKINFKTQCPLESFLVQSLTKQQFRVHQKLTYRQLKSLNQNFFDIWPELQSGILKSFDVAKVPWKFAGVNYLEIRSVFAPGSTFGRLEFSRITMKCFPLFRILELPSYHIVKTK